ncbi:MAG: HNH endonuclease [Gammaproteobacteria bacterium]
MYCGDEFSVSLLTRDHVTPLSRGGKDVWENVVTCCRPCNEAKDDHLLEENEMDLLSLPYAPNRAEGLILANRRILADQMDYLLARVNKVSRLKAA